MTMRKVGSVSCLLLSVAAIIFGLFFRKAGGWFISFALFRTIQNGSFMGVIGNIFGVIIMVAGFAWAGLCGLRDNDKDALVSSATMLCVCAVSMLFAIFSHAVPFTFGDLIIMVPPALIIFDLFKSH